MTAEFDFEPDELLVLAEKDLDAERFDGALQKVKRALSINPESDGAQLLGGRLYAQLGLFERAKPLYQSFLQKHPESPTEQLQYGMVHLDSGDPSTALGIFEGLLKTVPDFPPAEFYRALALVESDRNGDAVPVLQKLIDSVDTDNLYHEQATGLLQSITGENAVTDEPEFDDFAPVSTDAYTQH